MNDTTKWLTGIRKNRLASSDKFYIIMIKYPQIIIIIFLGKNRGLKDKKEAKDNMEKDCIKEQNRAGQQSRNAAKEAAQNRVGWACNVMSLCTFWHGELSKLKYIKQ